MPASVNLGYGSDVTPQQSSSTRLRRQLVWLSRILWMCVALGLMIRMSGDNSAKRLTASERKLVNLVIAQMPHVAADRFQVLKGVYTWGVPVLPPCNRHWGLPVSTLDPFAAVYLKGIYAGRAKTVVPRALADAINSGAIPQLKQELFCDPMTWRFWLDPFTYELPPQGEVGGEAASGILKAEILANRHQGFISGAIRAEVQTELKSVRAALAPVDRGRVADVSVGDDVYPPLAASADRAAETITLSDALVRYVVVREVAAREDALKLILAQLMASGNQATAAASIKFLADQTVDAVRRELSFILAHELAHLWVPTIDEREADCYGLATVVAQRHVPEIGIFQTIRAALAQGRSDYWNGLPASVIDQRFELIRVWSEAVGKGANLRTVCIEAWKSPDEKLGGQQP
jgi:hypothetical protein